MQHNSLTVFFGRNSKPTIAYITKPNLVQMKVLIVFKFWFICIVSAVWGIDAEIATKSWNDDGQANSNINHSNNTSDLTNKLKYQFNSLMKQKMSENLKSGAYRSPSSSSSSSWYGVGEVESDPAEGFQPQQYDPQDDNNDAGTTSEQEIETESIDGVDDSLADDPGDNIRVAVQSKRRFEFVPVHYDREDQKAPRMIEIVSDTMPLRLHFKSQSAAIVVTQSHMSPPMKPIDETITMDKPFRLTHKAYKPIIQDVNEIIQPYRNIVQQVKPVIEDIRTIVPQDNDIYHKHHHQRPEKREPKQRFLPEAKPKTKTSVPFEPNLKSGMNSYNKLNNYGILQLDQSERVSKTIENVGPPPKQQQHGIRKRMDSYFFERRPRVFNQRQLKPIKSMNGRSQNARFEQRNGRRDNFMRIESSEPEMIYVDRHQNWNADHLMRGKDHEMIVGDLLKDNIIREDHGLETVANLFPPMVLMKNDDVVEHHDFLEHHLQHHHHHGPTAASIFDNGDVTIEEEEEHNANMLDYMDNSGGPYFHHHHHRHHLLHLDHDEDGHDHDHHHDDHNDQHFFATLV